MIVELGMNLATGAQAEATLMVGLTLQDVERLRSGEHLRVVLREAGLLFFDGNDGPEPRTLVFAFGSQAEPKRPGQFVLTESMITWIRDTIPISEKLANLGFPEGKLIVFHGKTDEETAAAVRRHKEKLARTLIPDTSVVTTYTLDKRRGRVSVERFERKPRGAEARPNWTLTLASAVGSIAAFGGALHQPDALGRSLCIGFGVVLAAVALWTLRDVLRRGDVT